MLIGEVTDKEIKQAVWSISGDKSPGKDGYESQFYKDAWEIVGSDVIGRVKEFFTNGKLIKMLNNTVITLIPKGKHATGVGDYRPIACCNTMYKVISKVMYNRLKNVLPNIISPCQSALLRGEQLFRIF